MQTSYTSDTSPLESTSEAPRTFKSLGSAREERIPIFGLYNVYYKIAGRLVPVSQAPRARKI